MKILLSNEEWRSAQKLPSSSRKKLNDSSKTSKLDALYNKIDGKQEQHVA